MSDVSDDEEGRQDENLVVSDDEDPYIQGNFKHRIHSTKIVTDTSASIFVQENRYDRHGLTPNGNIDKLFDHVSITNASAIRYCPSYQDAKHHKSRDEPDPFTSRYHHSLNKFQEYVEGTLPLSYIIDGLNQSETLKEMLTMNRPLSLEQLRQKCVEFESAKKRQKLDPKTGARPTKKHRREPVNAIVPAGKGKGRGRGRGRGQGGRGSRGGQKGKGKGQGRGLCYVITR